MFEQHSFDMSTLFKVALSIDLQLKFVLATMGLIGVR